MALVLGILRWMVVGGAVLPLVYYLVVIYSGRRFFRRAPAPSRDFTPPLSLLKPVCGLDRAAYDNFASFCAQDYPEYEILFGAGDPHDPAIPVIERLIRDFPDRPIRLFIGARAMGTNEKASNLCRLAHEARHEILVISDSDVRVKPDYLRTVVSPFRNLQVGAVTCLYTALAEETFANELEGVGIAFDFLPSVMVARQLEGVKFALGATIAIRRDRLAEMGGFEAVADYLADDFEVGFRVAARGHLVELLPYAVSVVLPSQRFWDLAQHQLRWAISMRHSRPWGYTGLLLTQGLPWALAALAVSPSARLGAAFLAAYLALRFAMAWAVAVWGLGNELVRKKWWLIPLWDALKFFIWAASFFQNRVRWRGKQYFVRNRRLIPVSSETPVR